MALIILKLVLAVELSQKDDTSTTYTKIGVNDMTEAKDTTLAAQQNTLTVIAPMNLRTPVASYPLLIDSNMNPRLSVQIPLSLTRNEQTTIC